MSTNKTVASMTNDIDSGGKHQGRSNAAVAGEAPADQAIVDSQLEAAEVLEDEEEYEYEEEIEAHHSGIRSLFLGFGS